MRSISTLAIDGGTPVRTTPWPTWPIYDQNEEQALLDVLHSGQWWSVGGTRVPEFEAKFAAMQGARHGVAVTNGTAALEIALRGLGIGCGDEVIVPPYSFIATASSVLAVSATPIFVDIEYHSYNIDPARIEEAITPKTKAIIPVHIAGCPADMDGVLAVAKRHNLFVIEDAAQAHLAEWNGTKVGAIGTCGTFSHQASKNLNAGEGGMIVTNLDEVADQVWSVANVGRSRTGKWYEHNVLGGNFRMTEWQAAILLTQMERLPNQTALRAKNADYLTTLLQQIPGITTLKTDSRVSLHANHLFMFRVNCDPFGGKTHEEFLSALAAEGIECGAGYVPLYREKVFQGGGGRCRSGRPLDYLHFAEACPVCEEISKDTVWLFQHQLLGNRSDMDDVATAIEKIRKKWNG